MTEVPKKSLIYSRTKAFVERAVIELCLNSTKSLPRVFENVCRPLNSNLFCHININGYQPRSHNPTHAWTGLINNSSVISLKFKICCICQLLWFKEYLVNTILDSIIDSCTYHMYNKAVVNFFQIVCGKKFNNFYFRLSSISSCWFYFLSELTWHEYL